MRGPQSPAALRPCPAEREGARLYACRLYALLLGKVPKVPVISPIESDRRIDVLPESTQVLVRFELDLLWQAARLKVYSMEPTPEALAQLVDEWRLAKYERTE